MRKLPCFKKHVLMKLTLVFNLKTHSGKSHTRSSRPEVFCKKGVLKSFAKFTGKHLCQGLFFNKVASAACNFIKKETLAQVYFALNFVKFLRTPFFREHLWWLLLTLLHKISYFEAGLK